MEASTVICIAQFLLSEELTQSFHYVPDKP